MQTVEKPRRSVWMYGYESEEPTEEQRRAHAREMSARLGVDIQPPPKPRLEDLRLRPPRVTPPDAIAGFCFQDTYERALHSHGGYREQALLGRFPDPPDVVAHPRSEEELEAVLDWCSRGGHAVVPYGGGSSVVDGVTPPEGYDGIVSIDMDGFDRVLEVDRVSRAARIQAGAYGPALEDQLRPHGLTLRHFPQSFTSSTLGGWIATRSGGHYATKDTHIDDLVESVRMLTPAGWWESRRLPGSGAGPSPRTAHSAWRLVRPVEPKASAPARASSTATGSPPRSRRSAGSAKRRRAGRSRAATMASALASAMPLIWRKPRRSAWGRAPPSAASRVQSQCEWLTSTGRTGTPCSRASRTSWAGA